MTPRRLVRVRNKTVKAGREREALERGSGSASLRDDF